MENGGGAGAVGSSKTAALRPGPCRRALSASAGPGVCQTGTVFHGFGKGRFDLGVRSLGPDQVWFHGRLQAPTCPLEELTVRGGCWAHRRRRRNGGRPEK